jgi:hypothetical protein
LIFDTAARHHPHHGRFPGRGFGGIGIYAPYYGYDGYYPYYYDDDYEDGGCYLVRRRVMTRYRLALRGLRKISQIEHLPLAPKFL